MAVGKSRARVYVEHEIKVRFDDVAGLDEAKEELKEVIEFLRTPEKLEGSVQRYKKFHSVFWSGEGNAAGF